MTRAGGVSGRAGVLAGVAVLAVLVCCSVSVWGAWIPAIGSVVGTAHLRLADAAPPGGEAGPVAWAPGGAAGGGLSCGKQVGDVVALRAVPAVLARNEVACLRVGGSTPPDRPTEAGNAGSAASAPGSGPPGAGTPVRTACTVQAASAAAVTRALAAAAPGARICVTGDLAGTRLRITRSGSAQAPIAVIGTGRTVVKGITVQASYVVVDGFQVLNAQAPGIEITGNNITVRNNTVVHPTGGDFDGLRFFGNNLAIVHNTISNITNTGGAHADCMQTFTNGEPSSEHVLIDGNRCEHIDNQCLMAEGPGDVGDGGGGDGTSADWTWSNNVCQFGASQGVMIEAVQNVTIRNNLFAGQGDKAIGLDIGSTGATILANLVQGGIDHEVGMDETSKQGYQGPQPGGGP